MQLVDTGWGILADRQVLGDQLDLAPADAAVGIDEISRDLNSGIFLLRQRGLGSTEREQRPDFDGAARRGRRATPGAEDESDQRDHLEPTHQPHFTDELSQPFPVVQRLRLPKIPGCSLGWVCGLGQPLRLRAMTRQGGGIAV